MPNVSREILEMPSGRFGPEGIFCCRNGGLCGLEHEREYVGDGHCAVVSYLRFGRTPQHPIFLGLGFAEDVCYFSVVCMQLNQGEIEVMGLSTSQVGMRAFVRDQRGCFTEEA